MSRKYIFTAGLLFMTLFSLAQENFNVQVWKDIETGIRQKKNLGNLQDDVARLKQKARESNDLPALGRCFYYQLLIADRKTEDTLYFKNSLFIDSILQHPQSPPLLKSIMYVLKAERISGYTQQFFSRGNKNLVRSYDPKTDYSKMDRPALDSLAYSCFEEAKKLSLRYDTIPVEKLLWLSHDPFIFLFRPCFTDIIYEERIHLLQTYSTQYFSPGSAAWLSLSQDEFMQLPDTVKYFRDQQQAIFRLYKQWMQYHRPVAPGSTYFIETLARKFFYNALYPDTTATRLYEEYLQALVQSSFTPVKAHGIYQLCLRWNSDAAKYNPAVSNIYYDYEPGRKKGFDTAYCMYYVRTLTLLADHERLLDSFPFIRRVLLKMKENILAPGFHISTDDSNLPGAPIPASLRYRNMRALHIRILRVSPDYDPPALTKELNIARYLQLPSYRDAVQLLPSTTDHQWHNAFLKLDPLPAGRYIILFADTTPAKNLHVDYVDMQVTQIAAIHNEGRVFVLDRRTGYPLQGAFVIVKYRQWKMVNGVRKETQAGTAPEKVNPEGYMTVREINADRLKVFINGDTVTTTFTAATADQPQEIFDKDRYDDLMEYYEQNAELHMFTDRAIYRPGQTVHYKGIFIIRHPRTGEPLVLNWKNLQFPFFKKLLYKLMVNWGKKKIESKIRDPFGKEMDTIKVRPNQYGSFAGSFVLPKDAATGEWEFDVNDIAEYRHDGRFKVEEYKRPSFELKLQKPQNELYLGDSFTIKALASSFTGSPLSHVLIKYEISGSGQVPGRGRSEGMDHRDEYRNETICTGQSYTDDKGELPVTVYDSALSGLHFTDDRKWVMNYTVKAEAIDATGENHEEKLNFSLSTQPVKIQISLPSLVEKQDLTSMYISTSSDFAGPVRKQVEINLFRLPAGAGTGGGDRWPSMDIWLHSREQLQNWFGNILPDSTRNPGGEQHSIFRGQLLAGGEDKFNWPKELLQSGQYSLEIVCRENGKITGKTEKKFAVFDKAANTLPGSAPSFEYLHFNRVANGQPITWITGNTLQNIFSIYHLAYSTRAGKGSEIKYEYDIRPEKKGINEWQYPMPQKAIGTVTLTHLYIINNQLYKQTNHVYLPAENTNPEIIVERYRKIMAPGTKEKFVVSVKTKNKNTAAELMATLYDASLDKLENQHWNLPYFSNDHLIRNNWDNQLHFRVDASWQNPLSQPWDLYTDGERSLWWLDPADYPYTGLNGWASLDEGNAENRLEGRVAGLNVLDSRGLDDVVVVGYSTTRRSLAGAVSTVTIRGAATLKEYSKTLIILDGVLYEGDIGQINIDAITQGIILKGADAMALYGSRAANGVLLLSTKGPVQIPGMNEPPPVTVRRNFAETGFFYPQLYADRSGYYAMHFTLPETVTEWKWKMLAHTKKAAFAYSERTLFSQLPLMVQPDMPRLLYQGDSTLLTSRILNTDTADQTGILRCHIEDAVTGEDLTGKLTVAREQPFSVAGKSNATAGIRIAIPSGLLHPLRIRISASAGNFSDGEEHTLPILARKLLISRNLPLVLYNKKDLELNMPNLPADAEPYGIGLYITPKPQAAMIHALPYLAGYPYTCAEQTFNKLLAHVLAISIVRTDKTAQAAIENKYGYPKTPGTTRGEEAGEQPGLPGEQAMPWLKLDKLASEHREQLRKLLDTLQCHRKIEKYIADLEEMQNSDGGITWFKGGKSSRYISEYILAGFGKIKRDKLPLPDDKKAQNDFSGLLSRLIDYCDAQFSGPPAQFSAPLTNDGFSDYLYARSFWVKEYPLPAAVKEKADTLLKKYWSGERGSAIGHIARMISATLRYAPEDGTLFRLAAGKLESIRQQAITDEEHGMRWKDISDTDDLNTQTEEWVVRVAEAFEDAGRPDGSVKDIIKWLLQSRLEHNWSTTKSTADAVSLLHRQQTAVIGDPLSLKLTTGTGVDMEVSDDLLSGQGYAFSRQSGAFPSALAIRNNNPASPIAGGINFYYFSADPATDGNSAGVKISKALFRYNGSTRQWDPVTAGTFLKIGDKLNTVLTIDAPGQLQYVFIEDKRAAALEPSDAESGYEYTGGLEYYRSMRDIGCQFFSERIPSGISTISYESVADREGSFLSGAASLQCMYQPAVRACSNTSVIKVIK